MCKQQSKLNEIGEETLKQSIRLLKPFKYVLKVVRSANTSSLYMMLIRTLTLKKNFIVIS